MLPETKTKVAILGGDPLVVRTLETLLRGVGYEARPLGNPGVIKADVPLEGIDVLLFWPALIGERCEDFLSAMTSTLKRTIPILSFSPGAEGALVEEDRLIPWPCKIEDLTLAIESALRAAEDGESVDGLPTMAEEASA